MDAMSGGPHYVYILLCGDFTLYTGWTTRLAERVAAHNNAKGAKYTRSRLPVSLAYYESFPDKSSALKREREIKLMSRAEKLELMGIAGTPYPKS